MTDMRCATLDELRMVLYWAAEEGWNPGLDDAEAFFAADPQGFFVAVRDGAPVAAISVVNHNADFAFLGLYLVQPEWRGRGLGLALWQHALKHAGTRTVGLDGVPDQQENYAASGFAHAGATTRYVGMVTVAPQAVGIRPAINSDQTRLIEAEARASGASKPAYLSAWFSETGDRKTRVLGAMPEEGGFYTVRRCREGAKIGPLVAKDLRDAETLIRDAAGVFPGPLVLDVPAAAPTLAQLCRDLGMTPGFHTARMYRGAFTPARSAIFAVTSLELG